MFKLFDPPQLSGKYLSRVLKSKWLTTGPMNERLRNKLAEWLNWPVAQIVLASSATMAFQVLLDMLRARGFKTIDIQSDTWTGMYSAITHSGLTYRSPGADVRVITDIGGNESCNDQEVSLFECKIQDACHSWIIQENCDFTLCSFYPTKLVAGAEGGVLFCRSPGDVEGLVRRLNCGLRPVFDAEIDRMTDIIPNGYKGNMTDVQAALNLEAVEKAPEYIKQLQESHRLLASIAKDLDISYKHQPRRAYLFQIVCEREKVQIIRKALFERAVLTAWNFPTAGQITLPMVPRMGRGTATRMLKIVRRVLDESSSTPIQS